jgi:hypothetical protein
MGAEHVFRLEHVQGLREKRGKTGTLSDPVPRHCTVSQQSQSPTLSKDTDKIFKKKLRHCCGRNFAVTRQTPPGMVPFPKSLLHHLSGLM